MKKKTTTDALKIIDQMFYHGKPERQAELEQAFAEDAVARKIYSLRTKAGLTQKQLAKMVGTTDSVISRLEDADYEGHSMAMLTRIAAALDKRVEIRFVSIRASSPPVDAH
ncbi:MAG: helix-turn-helix transcriptional regulator [Roseimicrobium sp.]